MPTLRSDCIKSTEYKIIKFAAITDNGLFNYILKFEIYTLKRNGEIK